MLKLIRYAYYSIFKGLDNDSKFTWQIKWKIYHFLRKTNVLLSIFKIFFLKNSRCDVLLINPDKYDTSVRNVPIALACIASHLEKHCISARILDLWGAPFKKTLLKLIINLAKPKLVGISITITMQAYEAYDLGNFIKKHFPQINIAYGGLHATYFPEEPFEKGSADYVILGEGEAVTLQLVKAINQERYSLNKIKGLVCKKKGGLIKNEGRQALDLNKTPFPAYHLLDMKSYDTDIHILPYAKERAVDIMTSRGCMYNCMYCSSPFLYKHDYRTKNPKLMLKEVEHLKKKYNLKFFHFHDDDFLLDPERISIFCNLLKKNNLNITWLCLTNVNTLLKNIDLLKKMKEAGCVTIEFGIETADKGVLKRINKAQQTDEVLRLSQELKKQGITPQYLVMSFNLGETLDSAYKTARFIYKLNYKKNPPVVPYLISHHHNFALGFLTTPYPGSKLYTIASKEGLVLTKKWGDYYPERVNFIPNSFLMDTPKKTKALPEKDFLKEVSKYKEVVQSHLMNNYRIYSNLKDFGAYQNFLYTLFQLCDSKKCIKDIHEKTLEYDSRNNIGYTCSGLRFLAMFGLIKSK